MHTGLNGAWTVVAAMSDTEAMATWTVAMTQRDEQC